MRRPRRTWGQRLLIAFNCSLVMVCLAAGAGLAYSQHVASEQPRVSLGSALTPKKPASEPQNILLVGIDDGDGLEADDPVLNFRDTSRNTDTIMILRVDPGSDQAALLSLPRDLWVDLGASGTAKGKINEAFARGGDAGPENLIATINRNFNIEIDHYAQVNLAGFRGLVSAVDGVPVYFPWPARDRHSGLAIEEPGCVKLTPTQALDLTRSRYFEKYEDGKWTMDPASDLGRIQRQQMFMRAALKQAISKGVRNPVTLNQLVNVARQSITIDETFTGQQILDLGMEFKDFNPDSLVLYSPPVTRYFSPGGADALKLVEAEAQPIFDVFRGSADDLVRSTWVEVRNGSGVAGQGKAALDALAAHGFAPRRSGDSSTFDGDDTVVLYAPGEQARAIEVARFIDGPLRFQEDIGLKDVSVAVVTGDAFRSIRQEPVDVTALEAELPTTTTTVESPTPPADEPTAPDQGNPFALGPPPGVSCG